MKVDLLDLDSMQVMDDNKKHLMAVCTPQGASIDVFIQDQTSRTVDRYLTQVLNPVTLAAPLVFNQRQIQLAPDHGFVVNNMIEILEGHKEYQGRVRVVAGNTITVDMPVCTSFSVDAIAHRTNPNLNVNGAVTPVVFQIKPPPGKLWDINLMSASIIDDTAMDDAKFGGITALTNGVVFRTVNSEVINLFAAQNNSCFKRHCDYFQYSDRAPAGSFGFNTIRHFNSQTGDGVARRIGGDEISEFQAIVQDDLTALTTFLVVIRGHVVED
jgi:hypothetical protein